jgi:hypothetical protein
MGKFASPEEELSRHIGVYREKDFAPSGLLGGWIVRGDAESLYDAPLGSEGNVYKWWSAPAAKLNLPLIESIYDFGFNHGIRWGGDDLRRVLSEIKKLEDHWRTMNLPDAELLYFLERSGCLRRAISIAVSQNGYVVIT